MAKLYFSYAAMNAGKSTILLQAAYNYRERGMDVLLLTSALYKDDDAGHISSRIGIGADATLYTDKTDLLSLIRDRQSEHRIDAIFVDEAQFLTKEQVWQLARVADHLDVPV
ncbi:MAG: thymidine kinase, partial [Hyphomonas sp.]